MGYNPTLKKPESSIDVAVECDHLVCGFDNPTAAMNPITFAEISATGKERGWPRPSRLQRVFGGMPTPPISTIQPNKSALAAVTALVLTTVMATGGAKNLLPNGGFEGKDPLHGWLTVFPDEAFYKDNGAYVKMAAPGEAGGRKAVVLDLPAGIAGNQGGKLESVPVPVDPGATYRIEVDCMTWDLSVKIHAEAWSRDPHPEQKRTIFRRAPAADRPALMMCYRAQVPSPPGNSKTWTTASREFTVPKTVVVAGKDQVPEFLSVKVVNYGATMGPGKSYFANFRLFRVDAQADPPKP